MNTHAGALEDAGRERREVAVVCAGLSGVDRPSDRAHFAEVITDWFHTDVRVLVHNDAVAALASGTGGHLTGVVLIAGTGINPEHFLPALYSCTTGILSWSCSCRLRFPRIIQPTESYFALAIPRLLNRDDCIWCLFGRHRGQGFRLGPCLPGRRQRL